MNEEKKYFEASTLAAFKKQKVKFTKVKTSNYEHNVSSTVYSCKNKIVKILDFYVLLYVKV